jgi:hypothetical protein
MTDQENNLLNNTCWHPETIEDGESHGICVRCGAVVQTRLTYESFMAFADQIARQAGCRTPTEIQLFDQLDREGEG